MDQPQHISLFELNQQIRQALIERFPESAWVIAEISEIKISTAGHCYLELIQKDDKSASIKAKASATIWAATYRMLRPYFEMTTGRPLAEGMKILIRATVEFHEVYGLSLKVMDIDPTYTIGELELQRQQTIQQLIDDGVFDMNKQLPFPEIPQRLAVISSEKSAGYQDFIHQLQSNTYGFHIFTTLFGAIMQGKEAEPSILRALEHIFEEREKFDAVVLIRGGGAQTDLSCFDSYWLSLHLAQMPLPVITGIGHTKDVSIADMVSHTSVKTPTAAAELIIASMEEADQKFNEYGNWVTNYLGVFLENAHYELRQHLANFRNVQNSLVTKKRHIERKALEIKNSVDQRVSKEQLRTSALLQSAKRRPIAIIEEQEKLLLKAKNEVIRQSAQAIHTEHKLLNTRASIITNMHPNNLLKKGFSITRIGGKAIKSTTTIHPSDIVETTFIDGKITSKVLPYKEI